MMGIIMASNILFLASTQIGVCVCVRLSSGGVFFRHEQRTSDTGRRYRVIRKGILSHFRGGLFAVVDNRGAMALGEYNSVWKDFFATSVVGVFW
jgi:hypothetical protein